MVEKQEDYDSQQGGVLELTNQDWMPLPKVVDLQGQIGLREVPGKQKPPSSSLFTR